MSIACKVRPIGGEALLPDGYRRCEYLESTGTQWIVTETFSNVDYIEADFIFQYTRITGARQLFGLASSSPNFGINASGQWESFLTPADLNIHRLKMGMGRLSGELFFIFENARKDRVVGDWWNPDTVRWICNPFALDRTGFLPCCIRSYGAKVTGDNNLLCNLIPCLDDNDKPCMFDTVSRTAFYNQGTGEFLYKLKTPLIRKLPRGYQPLEYLESTGTQWIDTGISGSSESEVRCEFLQHYPSTVKDYRYLYHANNFYLMEGYINSLSQERLQTGARMNAETIYPYWYAEEKVTTIFNIKGLSINGEMTSWKAEVGDFESTNTLHLFITSTTMASNAKLSRIYSFSISRNGVLQLDFQPCLDPTGKPCMWDYVTRRPFYNQDTTGPDFLYG